MEIFTEKRLHCLVVVDIPASPLVDALQPKLDRMWIQPASRERAQKAMAELQNFSWLGAALISPDGLAALVSLHQLGVIDLGRCQPFADGRAMNAIDLLVDFAPDHAGPTDCGITPQPPETLLKPLIEAGISVRGHPHSPLPPLARALYHPDARQWVEALLRLGADPLQRSDDPLAQAQPALRPTCLALAAQQGLHELESLMVDKLLLALAEPPERHKALTLLERAIKCDTPALFSRLMAHPGIAAERMLGTAFQRWGREIGPSLARHLITAYAARHFIAELANRLNDAQLAAALPSSRGGEYTLYGLSRIVETGDGARLGDLRDTLLQLPRLLAESLPRLVANHEGPIREMIDNARLAAVANLQAEGTSTWRHDRNHAASHAAGEVFNELLGHAADRHCPASMLALLPRPARTEEHHLNIQNPQALFRKVAGFSFKDRAGVVQRLCEYIAKDANAPVSIQTLQGDIPGCLPPRPAWGAIPRRLAAALAATAAAAAGVTAYASTLVAEHTEKLAVGNWVEAHYPFMLHPLFVSQIIPEELRERWVRAVSLSEYDSLIELIGLTCKIHLTAIINPPASGCMLRGAKLKPETKPASRRKKSPLNPIRPIARSSQRMLYPAAHSTACNASPSAPFNQHRAMPLSCLV